MKKKTAAQKLFVPFIILLLLGLFGPLPSAQAADPVTGFLSWSFESIVSKITGFFLGLAGNAISWLASLVDSFIQYQTNNGVYGVFVVDQSWTIVRNFVNMFFILVLIIMAFGTIFGMEKYSYRQMLGPFLIAALLVNFSLAIGQYIISFANGLSSIFLKQMGSLSASFAQGTSLVKLATNDSALKLAGDIVGAGPNIAISAIFSVVLLVIVLIALLAIAIFTVARLFMLWFLLIISPIAWVGYSMPYLRQRTWGDWWENFLCWCFFLPYYLFFMLFALMFIQNKDNPALKMSDPSQTLIGLSANDFLFYSLSIVFMVGGLGIAKKLACASGHGVGKVFGAVEGYAQRITRYSAVKKGLTDTYQRAKEEGLPGKVGGFLYGGERAERQRAARMGERFQSALGYRQTFAAQKDFLTSANKEYENVKQQFELGRITINDIRQGVNRNRANTAVGYAYRKMLGEVGQLDPAITRNTLGALRDNPYAAVDFIKNSSNKGKLSSLRSDDIRAMAADRDINVAARKQLFRHIQGDTRVAADLTPLQFNQAMELFGGSTTSDGSAFLKDIGKIRPDLNADYILGNPVPGAPVRTREQIVSSFVTNAKDIANIPYLTWNTDLDFQRALYDTLHRGSPKRRQNFRANLEDAVQETGRDVVDKQNVINALVTGPRP